MGMEQDLRLMQTTPERKCRMVCVGDQAKSPQEDVDSTGNASWVSLGVLAPPD